MEKKNIARIRKFILDNKPAFLFGNGINRYKTSKVEWNDILLELLKPKIIIDKVQINNFKKILGPNGPKDYSNIEMYDMIDDLYKNESEPQNAENENLQKTVCELIEKKFKKSATNVHYMEIVNVIKNLDLPLMTTNYDDLFEQYANVMEYKSLNSRVVGSGKYGSHSAYQWNKFFSDRKLTRPDEHFAIWHVHGTIKDFRTIHMGFNHYVGMLARAKSTIQNTKSRLNRTNKSWYGDNTWLDLIYNKNLVIVGFGLPTTEIFLRWLLRSRSRHLTDYTKKTQSEKLPSLYLTTAEKPISLAQRLFLESCGFEIIQLSSYKELYEDLWDDWPKK